MKLIRNNLYHYTNLTALSKIIEAGKLLFGSLPKMNDITEASKDVFLEGPIDEINWDKIEQLQNRLLKIGQISLSKDGIYVGFAINSMWGNYADKGEGCCIMLDEERLVNECLSHSFKFDKIYYDGGISEIIIPSQTDIETYLIEQYHKLFFHKSQDWNHEQEFRILKLDFSPGELEGISLDNCIKAIILHTNCKCSVFDCPAKQKIIEQIDRKGIPILEYVYSSMWSQNNKGPMLIDKSGNDILHNYQYDINI